ncbi:MAG: phospholipase D-like domain-containing protein [Nocardioidaceae bacterium]
MTPPASGRRTSVRSLVRRALLSVLGLQLGLAIGLTLVDSWRRRGRRSKPFPVTPPAGVPVGDGTVTTYTYGEDLYADMLAAIEGAADQILFESYIWKGDAVGRRFKNALEAAAERGVEVYVIYDGFANLVVPRHFKSFSSRIRVLEYPVYHAGWRFFDVRLYGRDHRKILVVDNQVAFVGGFNVGDDYATKWRDTHMSVTGPEVWDLHRAFVEFWNLNHEPADQVALGPASDWDPTIQVHRNVPRVMIFPIRAMYLEAIYRARHHIYLTHAYFIPDRDLLAALIAAAQRDVDVRLLVPATSNHVVADWLSRGYYTTLLQGGIRIHLYQDSMVHAKTATIDGRWSTIGTANIDRLSMTGNYEVNIECVDDGVAAQMSTIFETDLSNSEELTAAAWAERGLARRFTEAVLAPLRPLL